MANFTPSSLNCILISYSLSGRTHSVHSGVTLLKPINNKINEGSFKIFVKLLYEASSTKTMLMTIDIKK